MKEKLRAGEPVFGVSVMIPSPQIVEMIAAAGFDWVLLDCEHGTLTLESVELMAMAAEACGHHRDRAAGDRKVPSTSCRCSTAA